MSRVHLQTGAPLRWIDVGLAALALAVLGAPWPTPSPEALIETFSSDLITVATTPPTAVSAVQVTKRALTLAPAPSVTPTVHLVTSEVPFDASFSATVLSREDGTVFPLQFKIWHPRTEVAIEAWYAPDGSVMAGTREGDRWLRTRRLGEYAIGESQGWRLVREEARVAMTLTRGGQETTFAVPEADFPALFAEETLSLTVYATGIEGRAFSAVRDPLFTVSRQNLYGTRVRSPWFRPVIAAVAAGSLIRLGRRGTGRGRGTGLPRSSVVLLLLLVAMALSAGAYVSRVPGHPLDMRHAELWSRIGETRGPENIVGQSLLATEGSAHGGLPYAAVTYPYPPLLTYVFWAAGRTGGIEGAGRAVKLFSLMAVVAGGVLLYVLLLHLGVRLAAAAAATAAYILNPAVFFASAVWGQTDAFVAFFLLLASAGLVLAAPSILWVGAFLALLSKQTGAIFVPMLFLAGLSRFGAGRLLRGLPPAILVIFLMLTPLLWLGVHPAATYRPLVTKLLQFGTVRNMESVSAVVSQGGFTVWSVLTALDGARGIARMATPDFEQSPLGPSYFALSRLVFGLVAVGVATLLYLRRKTMPAESIFLALGAYGVGIGVLLTRVQPRYQFFGVMFAAASLPWMSRRMGGGALAILSSTMLCAMWGMLVFHSALYPGVLPYFDPDRSALHRLMGAMLTSDAAITIAGLLNLSALLLIMAALVKAFSREREGGLE